MADIWIQMPGVNELIKYSQIAPGTKALLASGYFIFITIRLFEENLPVSLRFQFQR